MKRRHFLRMFGLGAPLSIAIGSSGLLSKIGAWFATKPARISFSGTMISIGKHALPQRIDALNLDNWRMVQMDHDQRDAWENTGITVSKLYD